ncbi:hypothetical protein [Aquamicrobium defluvii]|uniref:Uncharacterized protein n=1 Tax=Aquamicrobium defluvii TaxID=69279 RepID=A0A4R6Y4I5_9HYPH|nr:hypothetical protein [Aquamicrobium defluvii]TDR27812.1 hypothetical protein DES43_1642 [Aquamicrobium defluvii]
MSARDVIAEELERYTVSPGIRAESVIAALRAAGYAILSPDEVRALERALSKAEDGAGTLPAQEAVKLRPSDWHALAAAIRSLKGGRDAQ